MKTGLLVTCLALLPLTAQDNSELKHLTLAPNGRTLFATIRVAAKDIEQSVGIVYLKGSVEINFGTYVLIADEAEYDQTTGEIQPRGNVHLKPANMNARGASQFGIK